MHRFSFNPRLSRIYLIVVGLVIAVALVSQASRVAAHQDAGPQWVNDWVMLEIFNTAGGKRNAVTVTTTNIVHPGHVHWLGVIDTHNLGNMVKGAKRVVLIPDHMTRSGDPECTPATAFDFQVTIQTGGNVQFRRNFNVPPGGAVIQIAGLFKVVATHQTRTDGPCTGTPERDKLQAPEVDFFPQSKAEVELTGGPFGSDTVTLSGPTTVIVDLGSLTDLSNECSSPDPVAPNGLEEVQTEIVQMELTGTSSPITLRLRDSSKSPFQRSTGQIEEGADTQPGRLDVPPFDPTAGPACSFFDVFFEIELEDGTILHNETPKRMQASITNKPPAEDETYQSPDEVELFDENNNPTGIRVAGASHTPNPSVPAPPIPALTPLGTIAMALLITLFGIRRLCRSSN